jgi:hypothetical protein
LSNRRALAQIETVGGDMTYAVDNTEGVGTHEANKES